MIAEHEAVKRLSDDIARIGLRRVDDRQDLGAHTLDGVGIKARLYEA